MESAVSKTTHPLLTVPLRYRLMLLGAGAHAVIRRTYSGWEVVQSHAVRDGDEVCMRATAPGPNGSTIALGECTGRGLPAV